jgi:hypothetical protein
VSDEVIPRMSKRRQAARNTSHNQLFRHSSMQCHGGYGLHLIMILHVFNFYEMMISECPCVWRIQRFG